MYIEYYIKMFVLIYRSQSVHLVERKCDYLSSLLYDLSYAQIQIPPFGPSFTYMHRE